MVSGLRGSGLGPLPHGFVGAIIFFCVLISAACTRREASPPALIVEHEVTPQPVRVGGATIAVRLLDRAGKPAAGASITVEADMSHPGMSPAFAKEAEPGRYSASVQFGMAGDWVILLHISLPNGQKIEQQFEVRDVRPS